MKSKLPVLLLGANLCLGGCFGDKSQSPEMPESKTSESKTSVPKIQAKGKLIVSITGLEAIGKDCDVRMKIYNGTGKEIQTYQMRDLKVSTKAGVVMVDHSNNYPLDIGETYTRGGILVASTSCKIITQIQVNETICRYKAPMSEYMQSLCVGDVAYKSTRKIKFIK